MSIEFMGRRVVSRPETYFPQSRQSARAAACAQLFFALLQLHVAARTDEGVTVRGRSRTGPSTIFDPPREHLDSCNIRADSDPRRLGVQALMSTRKDRANGCFHNGWHGVEAACAFSPPGWSRSLPRMSARAILIKPQPRHRVNTPEKKICSPTNSPGHALHYLADGI